MKRFGVAILIILLTVLAVWQIVGAADKLKSTYNPFTGKQDFILDSAPIYSAIAAAKTPVSYKPYSVAVGPGALAYGNMSSVKYYDTDYLRVNEVVGTPGFIMDFFFKDIATFNKLQIHEMYSGSVSHVVAVQAYNWTLAQWDTLWSIDSQTTLTAHVFDFISSSAYISGGKSTIRLAHASDGVSTHYALVDYLVLSQDSGSGVTEHGLLTGLADDDHTQYALRRQQATFGNVSATEIFISPPTSNTRYGAFAAPNLISGAGANVAIGNSALRYLQLGDTNTAIGTNSLKMLGFGNLPSPATRVTNTAVGSESMSFLENGFGNTGIGESSWWAMRPANGNFNTFLGVNTANGFHTGSGNTFIGANSSVRTGYLDNSITIGYDSVSKGSNTTVLGSESTLSTYIFGNLSSNITKGTMQAAKVLYTPYTSSRNWQNLQTAITETNRLIPEACVNVFDGAQGERGFRGYSGLPGQDGQDGITYTMTVGTVTDLPHTSTPFVNYSATSATSFAVNYGLVQGAQGEAANVTEASVMSAFLADPSNSYLRFKALSGDPEKIRIVDVNDKTRLEITSTGLISIKDANGIVRWGFDSATNSMSMRRGAKVIFSINSTGQMVIGG